MTIEDMKAKGTTLDAINDRLIEGEEVLKIAHISMFIFWQVVAVFILGVLLGLLVFELGMLLILVSFIMGAISWLRRSILLMVLTNKRIFVRYGILQVDVVDIHFSKIESVELERMPTGFIMGYSNVIVSGTGNRVIAIPYVSNGVEIRKAYNEMTLNSEFESKQRI